jgi:hypothetical protein
MDLARLVLICEVSFGEFRAFLYADHVIFDPCHHATVTFKLIEAKNRVSELVFTKPGETKN